MNTVGGMITATWQQAIDDFVAHMQAGGYPLTTQRTRRQHLQMMARRIGVGPWEVTSEQLVQWAAAQSWVAQTRHSRRMTFKAFWHWAKHTRRCAHNPAKALPKVRIPQPSARPCPERIYRKAYMQADARQMLALELAHDHGLRRAEIAVVHTRDIVEDLVGYSILVHGKGAKTRTVPLTPRTAALLRELEPGWAFPGDDDGHLSPRWLGKIVNRLLEEPWTIHSLRHSFGTRTRRLSDLLVTQELLGHASPATTQVYCKVDREELRAAVLAAAS